MGDVIKLCPLKQEATMLNNTSKILPYTMPDSLMNGVILPRSDKVLFACDINKKIEKVRSQIGHLNQSLSHRNTHGGKAFRARNISIKDQISSASERMELLQSAKTPIIELNKQSKLIPLLNANAHKITASLKENCELYLCVL
jgi:hypothetical protein